MAREIDDKKTRKVLRKLRSAAKRAEAEGGPGLSDWEKEFVEEVETRLEKYGSAFADPDKGVLSDPLSILQSRKLKEIDKKSRGKDTSPKKRSGFKSSFKAKPKTTYRPRARDIHEDLTETETPPEVITPPPDRPKRVDASASQPEQTNDETSPPTRPHLRLIKGNTNI